MDGFNDLTYYRLLIPSLGNITEFLWNILSSNTAIFIYVLILLVLLLATIMIMIRVELKRTQPEVSEPVKHTVKTDLNVTIEQPKQGDEEDIEVLDEEVDEESRFFMLSKIDIRAYRHPGHQYDDEITLRELCEEFRNFAADSLKLYYDIADIRRFIGGLTVSKIMILQGMSGTGKTSLAYALGEYIHHSSVVVPVQPMWKERTDLIGYYNEFTKKFNETTLLQKLYSAGHDDQMYITILDEMNIARVEYYFAEFLSLLELPDHNKRFLDVIADVWDSDPILLKEGKMILPKNMWFIGTANNDDSTFAISDKVYDRAMVMNLDKKAHTFLAKPVQRRKISAHRFEALTIKAQQEYALSKRNLRRLRQLDKYLIQQFHISFGNRIMTQIMNYTPVIVACGGSELSAIDDIMSKKVLRKLETKNMVYVKSQAPGLISYIEELFGEGEMELCREYIQNIEINA